MSELRQASEAARRSGRTSGAGDVAVLFRKDCRTLRDSLQLEMAIAQYILRLRDVRTPDGVPVGDAISAGVIAELERVGDKLSHAILRGLAHLGTGLISERSADAVARLAERDVGLPVKFGDVAGARPVGAWRESRGGFTGEYVFLAEFEHARGRRHAIALFVEPRDGGRVKHIGLLGPIGEFDTDDSFHPSAMETIETGAAGSLLRELLERSFGSSLERSDDFRVVIAAARARAMEEERLAVER